MTLTAIAGRRMILVERSRGAGVTGRGRGAGRHAEEGRGLVTALAGELRDGRVVDHCAGERCEVRRRVATLAGRAVDRNVIRRNTGRLNTVVAARASGRDALVIENRTCPADGRVAGVALQVSVNMRRSFALGLHIVVTRRATTPCLRVVKIHRRFPGDRCVAAIASVRGKDVIRRLRCGANRSADSVARGTIMRRALEDGVGVAGLTGEIPVLSEELEPCCQVVECVAGLGSTAIQCVGQ